MANWPEDGRLSASSRATDAVVVVKGSRSAKDQGRRGWCSVRSAAMSAPADMSNYAPLAAAMAQVGLFDALPGMLAHSLPYPYGCHRSFGWVITGRWQQQFVAERSLNIASNCALVPGTEHLAASVAKLRACSDVHGRRPAAATPTSRAQRPGPPRPSWVQAPKVAMSQSGGEPRPCRPPATCLQRAAVASPTPPCCAPPLPAPLHPSPLQHTHTHTHHTLTD